MKNVSAILSAHLSTEKNFASCDLYELRLLSGAVYRFAAYDVDVTYNSVTYDHKLFKFKRDQLRLIGEPSVDSLSVTIYCEPDDTLNGVPFMKACHDGMLEQATLTLSKAFFDDSGCIGIFEVFAGRAEVAASGGLAVKLTVKSILQGLAAPLPVRMFAGQAAYAENNGVVTASSTDTTSMLIPLKPSMNVLLKV